MCFNLFIDLYFDKLTAANGKYSYTERIKKRSEATQTLRAGCSKADPQTNTQTDRGDYNTLRGLARSVKIR